MHTKIIALTATTALTLGLFTTGVYASDTDYSDSASSQTSIISQECTELDKAIAENTNLSLDEDDKLMAVNSELKPLELKLKGIQMVLENTDDTETKAELNSQAEDVKSKVQEKIDAIKGILSKAQVSENYGVDIDKILSADINLSMDEADTLIAVNNKIKPLKKELTEILKVWQNSDDTDIKSELNSQAQDINKQIKDQLDSVKDILDIAKTTDNSAAEIEKAISDSTNLTDDEKDTLSFVYGEIQSLKEQLQNIQEVRNNSEDSETNAELKTQEEEINSQIKTKLDSVKDTLSKAQF